MQAIRSSYLVAAAVVLLLAVLGSATYLAQAGIVTAGEVVGIFGVVTGFVGTITTAHVVATNTNAASS